MIETDGYFVEGPDNDPIVASESDLLEARQPRTAKAADQPCQLYAYHAPRPSRTQYHHRHPVYLQNELFGRIVDASPPDMMWLCGTCHDSVHDWLSHLLGRARKPDPEPGTKAKAEAERTYHWYKEQLG